MSGIMNMFVAAKTTVATAVDAFFNSVSLLLNTSSTNGAQNNTFLDSSTNNFTITRNGNTTQGTFTPFSQTGWSNYFTTSDGLSIGTAVTVGNTWTLECFFTVQQTGQTILVNGNGATGDPWIGLNGGYVYFSFGGTTRTFLAPYSLYTWYHLALTCNAGTVTVYLNGVQQDATQASPTSNFTVNRIGGYNGGGSNAWNGYISNLRITNTVVYSSAFTPSTTPLTAISGTALLTCQSNRFVDNSTNGYAITINAGTPSVQAFSPFLPTAAYDAAVVGGSGYFDGTGDYLSAPDNAAFSQTADFSEDCWVYFSGNPANGSYQYFGSAGGNPYFQIGVTGSGYFVFAKGFFSDVLSSNGQAGVAKQGTWYHVAITRQSNTCRLFVNGVLQGTATDSASTTSSGPFYIGQLASSYPFLGYMNGFRFVKGGVPSLFSTSSTTAGAAIFTPPTAPYTGSESLTAGSVSLLLNYTNAGIFDSAAKNVLETVGNAQVSTTQAKWGTTSMSFPTSNGNYLIGPPNQPNLLYGTGQYTVEAWIYPTSFTNAASGAFGYGVAGGYVDWGLEINTSGGALWIENNSVLFSASSNLSTNVWTHVAIVRTGSAVTLYYNGVSVGTSSTINNISGNSTSARLYVGTGAQVPGSRQFVGFIDDFRVTKGYARYTTTFTPATEAFPIQ
jgi:hypothetical protein